MDWNEVRSRWRPHRVDLARRWPRISEHDIDAIAGNRDQLSRRIQAIYGNHGDTENTEKDEGYTKN